MSVENSDTADVHHMHSGCPLRLGQPCHEHAAVVSFTRSKSDIGVSFKRTKPAQHHNPDPLPPAPLWRGGLLRPYGPISTPISVAVLMWYMPRGIPVPVPHCIFLKPLVQTRLDMTVRTGHVVCNTCDPPLANVMTPPPPTPPPTSLKTSKKWVSSGGGRGGPDQKLIGGWAYWTK